MKNDSPTSKHTEQLAMEKTWSAVRIRLGMENSRDRENNTERHDYQIAGVAGSDRQTA